MIKLVVYTQMYSKFKYSASWLNQMTFVESLIVLQSKPYEINLNTKQTSMFLMLNENFECLCVRHKAQADGACGISWSF